MLYTQHPHSEIPAGFLTARSPLPFARHIFGTKEHSSFPGSDEGIHALIERFGPIAWMQQVHGARLREATQSGSLPECDAVYTSNPNLWLAVKTADCVPILIASPYAVAAVHAGWRSAEQGILPRTIAHLCQTFQHGPDDLYLAFGPCLSQPHFEVEKEFIDKFEGQHGVRHAAKYFWPAAAPGKVLMDLPGLLGAQARAAGCLDIHMHSVPHCTYAQADLFNSYRRHTHAQAKQQPSSYAVQVSLIRRLPPA